MEQVCVNNLRVMSLYEIEKANSGHPGMALSSAPILYSLYANVMNYSPLDDKNIFRDRFVMSAGHGSSLLYATLNMFGFDISIDDLKKFRKFGSIASGHPETNKTCGVDCSTGPLGQGVSNAVGMAIAGKFYQAKFNKKDIKLFDNTIYCLVGDGCLMEGISYEATSLAGVLGLDNLVLIYDCNKRTIDGELSLTSNEDIKKRFESINFDVFEVFDGNSVAEITENLLKAKKSNKPSIVIVNTLLGYGSEFEDQSSVHGKPLNLKQIEFVKEKLNISVGPFEILDEVTEYIKNIKEQIKKRFDNQLALLEDYKIKYTKDYEKLLNFLNFAFNEKAIKQIENFKPDSNLQIREINHEIFSSFRVENLIGGSADVAQSTKMFNKFDEIFSANNYLGNRINYGVREQAMGGISNGITLFGGLQAYASCFMVFSDYLKPVIRMTSLMNLPVLYVFSHDNFLNGQDGPTHQTIEQLVMLRAIPNLTVFRTYNDAEIKAGYIYYLKTRKPTCLTFSRYNYHYLPSKVKDASRGAYVIKRFKGDKKITLIGSGCDVDFCLKVGEILEKNNIGTKVVSMPSTEVFDIQDEKYKNQVLSKNAKIFAIESGSNLGLIKYVKKGISIGIDKFGESASPEDMIKYYNFSPNELAKKILENL